MKSVLLLGALMMSVPAFASQNLELAGDCKPKVEKALTGLGEGKAQVETVLNVNDKMITVAYTRTLPEGVVSGEANLVLKETKEIARGSNVYMILCDVVSAEILN